MSALRDQLNIIRHEQGRLTAALVVDTARNPAHPLHDRFEWDEHENSEKYLLIRAGELIRSIKIERVQPDDNGDPFRINAFQCVVRANGPSYEPIEELVHDDIGMAILLRQAEREWRDMFRRYRNLKGFGEMVKRDVA